MPKGTARSAQKFNVAERRKLVAEDLRRGVLQSEIADKLGVDQAQISRDRAAILAEWKAARSSDMDAILTEELDKLALIEREAWAAWDKSKDGTQSITEHRDVVGGAARTGTTTRVETSPGLSQFLGTLLTVQERRAKLLGLDAPVKVKGEVVVKPEDAARSLAGLLGMSAEELLKAATSGQ